jgi:PTS system fructose-specific IIC component/fructose-specific PTS system IIC-like component
MRSWLTQFRQHLLTGVSYAVPFVACGGILIACAISLAPMSASGPDFSHSPTLKLISDVGAGSFALLLPVLAGYIAYSVAGRPALVPGFVGGYLSGVVKGGFLCAILAGLIAGYVVAAIKKLPWASWLRPILPILILPVSASLIVGVVVLELIGVPIAALMQEATAFLHAMSSGDRLVLGALLGAMIAFDMGGPVNKTAFFFGAAMISEGQYQVMGACAAAICTPPLGMGLATLMRSERWSAQEREAGVAALLMGLIGITEGAIPFAASDPLRVIPCLMVGSMAAGAIAITQGVGDHAPHGGPIVLPVIDGRLAFVAAIAIGTLITAVTANALHRRAAATKPEAS